MLCYFQVHSKMIPLNAHTCVHTCVHTHTHTKPKRAEEKLFFTDTGLQFSTDPKVTKVKKKWKNKF